MLFLNLPNNLVEDGDKRKENSYKRKRSPSLILANPSVSCLEDDSWNILRLLSFRSVHS